ncbi:MAG: hypothetical protein VYD19_06680 [Myxococcota bacterium]|nr:hypothetical protein [Myxococcota bacterium]
MAGALTLAALIAGIFTLFRWALGVAQRRREAHFLALKMIARTLGLAAIENEDRRLLKGAVWSAPFWFQGQYRGVTLRLEMRRAGALRADQEWTSIIAHIKGPIPEGLLVTRAGALAHVGKVGAEIDLGAKALTVSGKDDAEIRALFSAEEVLEACLQMTNIYLNGRKHPGEGELRHGQVHLKQPLTSGEAALMRALDVAVESALAFEAALPSG